MSDAPAILVLNAQDNVAVDTRTLARGEEAAAGLAVASERVPRGHKIATRAIARGSHVQKYGQVIGVASDDIAPGDHVHVHNVTMGAITASAEVGTDLRDLAVPAEQRSFAGYRREDGRVGTRNYIGILTSVNCSATVARLIAQECDQRRVLDGFANVDGVIPLVHGSGCGMSASGEGFEVLQRTIHGYARNPNFGGVLLVGLGCEVMQLPQMMGDKALMGNDRFARLTIQQEGGTRATVERGVEAVVRLARMANADRRQDVPLSHLVLGMQCGGSDAWSGITANPALGLASDMLVAHGATTILSETPEIYGAEHLLLRRAATQDVADRLMARIAWWEAYCDRNGANMNNNPSPGNKAGGLTTIFEKSLGAVAKAGSAPLSGVFEYGEPIDRNGLVYVDTPGYDPCSATGQIASGATLIVFTTGRGSVSGFKPAPCVKIATNSTMFRAMEPDMDINAGDILDGSVDMATKGAEIFEALIAAASGRPTKSEVQGFGDNEFVPWQIGAVM